MEIPKSLLNAWSNPYTVVVTACLIVVVVASHPLSLGIVAKGSNFIMKKLDQLPVEGEDSDGSTTTVISPVFSKAKAKAKEWLKEEVKEKRGDIESGLER